MELILNKVPEFEPAWQAHLEFWDGDEAGLSNDIAEFSAYLIENLASISSDRRKELFLFIESCLIEGDKLVKDAISTCLLENLLNAVSGERVSPDLFVDFLGTESRSYCKSWDEFTGFSTPSL